MRKLAKLCESDGGINDCLDGKFEENYDEPAKLFDTYAARAMFGYSERLFHILKEGSSNNIYDVKLQPLPLGTGAKRPLAAAQAFVKFMATPRMQAAVAGNEAFSAQMPLRYLLPISKSASNEPLLVSNRFYQDYFRNLYGYTYPNTGLLSARGQLAPAIRKYIKEE
ncbi:unnamed protein product [Rotaria sp. Silwood2]|nr:unnamed protein product [Rotaria sp. Silwood2]CAF2551519.1 unnamed protein product [Rotaria sp. Silwood2]CAF4593195.1 unnamed protein product [Rotaria sp. Silwood2]